MKIAIIDSAMKDQEHVVSLLRQYFKQNQFHKQPVIEQFSSGECFLKSFSENSYDLIFLAYFLTGMNGLKTAENIRRTDSSVAIIFLTISRDYAIDCYKVCASDYIVKPLTPQRLSESLSLVDLTSLSDRQSVQITCGRKRFRLLLKNIIYCDVSGHYVRIHTHHSFVLRSRISFHEFAQTMEPYGQFLPCYRGCLVNMDHIIHVDDRDFVMDGGARIPIRQKECARLKNIYYEYRNALARIH